MKKGMWLFGLLAILIIGVVGYQKYYSDEGILTRQEQQLTELEKLTEKEFDVEALPISEEKLVKKIQKIKGNVERFQDTEDEEILKRGDRIVERANEIQSHYFEGIIQKKNK